MNGQTSIGKRAQDLYIGPEFDVYTRVLIHVGQITDDQGNTTDRDFIADVDMNKPGWTPETKTAGRTLEITDPLGTQAKANALLTKLQTSKWQYQPYSAEKALLDPAAELGDGVSISDTFSAIYKRDVTFSSLMAADISAPSDEEIEHEFPYIPKSDRVYKREVKYTRSQLKINANEISSEVERVDELVFNPGNPNSVVSKISQTADSITTEVTRVNNWAFGVNSSDPEYHPTETLTSRISQNATDISARVTKTGGSSSSFAWSLQSDNFSLISQNKTVFKCTSSGVAIDGTITARTGYIGDGSTGFSILSKAIYNNLDSFGGTQTTGIYLGTDGIQLGQNFQVDKSGNLIAKTADLTGTITASSGTIGGFTISSGNIHNGITGMTDTSDADGVYVGINGIRLGNQFKVTKAGKLTATSGEIGGFTIGSGKLYTGSKSTLSSTEEGVYLGTNGVALGTGNVKITSGGRVTFKKDMEAIDDATNSNGFYLDSQTGIAFGGGKFKVTKAGAMTATSGTVGGWALESSRIYKQTGTPSFDNVTSYPATKTQYSVELNTGSDALIVKKKVWTKQRANATPQEGNWENTVVISRNGAVTLGNKFSIASNGNVTMKGSLTMQNADGTVSETISANTLADYARQGHSANTEVVSNGPTWTSGAAAGTSAKSTWDDAQSESRGINYIRSSQAYVTNTLWAPYGGTYLGSYQLGLSTVTIDGVTIAYVSW